MTDTLYQPSLDSCIWYKIRAREIKRERERERERGKTERWVDRERETHTHTHTHWSDVVRGGGDRGTAPPLDRSLPVHVAGKASTSINTLLSKFFFYFLDFKMCFSSFFFILLLGAGSEREKERGWLRNKHVSEKVGSVRTDNGQW